MFRKIALVAASEKAGAQTKHLRLGLKEDIVGSIPGLYSKLHSQFGDHKFLEYFRGRTFR